MVQAIGLAHPSIALLGLTLLAAPLILSRVAPSSCGVAQRRLGDDPG